MGLFGPLNIKKLEERGNSQAFHVVEAVEPIVQRLNDSEHNFCKAAATALKSLGWKPARDKAGANYWIALGNYAQCTSIGVPAVEALVNTAKSTYYSSPGTH
jgi:hypothetical protein